MSDHRWTPWVYDRPRRLWTRHCTVGAGNCTAVQTSPRRPRLTDPHTREARARALAFRSYLLRRPS